MIGLGRGGSPYAGRAIGQASGPPAGVPDQGSREGVPCPNRLGDLSHPPIRPSKLLDGRLLVAAPVMPFGQAAEIPARPHTYYVLAGNTPVLVHNCPAEKPGFFKRVFGKKEAAPEPAPNATVRDLRGLESDGGYDPIKHGVMKSISDTDLIAAAQQTRPPHVMSLYEGENTLMNGRHRMRGLLGRVDDPNSIITDDTPIFILGF